MRVTEILETCLYATNLEETARFYERVLGLESFVRVEGRHVFFRCGSRVLLLFDPRRSAESREVPSHGAHGAGHAAFAVPEAALAEWREHLERSGVEIESEVTWQGGGRSLYLRDPAGNSVELATPRTWSLTEAEVFGAPAPAPDASSGR